MSGRIQEGPAVAEHSANWARAFLDGVALNKLAQEQRDCLLFHFTIWTTIMRSGSRSHSQSAIGSLWFSELEPASRLPCSGLAGVQFCGKLRDFSYSSC